VSSVRALTPLAKTVCEGAIACAVGHEITDNPYDVVNAREQHDCWRWAWRYADALLAHVSECEVQAWLADQDAA
jgi:hypothetical protein